MRIQCIRDYAVEIKRDVFCFAKGRHVCGELPHPLFIAIKLLLQVPSILVLAFFAEVWVELVWCEA